MADKKKITVADNLTVKGTLKATDVTVTDDITLSDDISVVGHYPLIPCRIYLTTVTFLT